MITRQGKSKIYIILGMHKSGTTLVSRLLMDAGVYMGEFDMSRGYDAGNHLEMEGAAGINKDLLDCGDSFSLNVSKPLQLNKISREKFRKGHELVETLCHLHSKWGFKDPRSCLTYSYWEKIMPEHRLIVVYRHPSELIGHYFHRRYSPATVFKISNALQCWTLYNRSILQILKHKQDFLVLNFSKLMQKHGELRRFENFIGHPVTDRRDPDSYRSRGSQSPYYLPALIYNKVVKRENPLKIYNELEAYRKMQVNSVMSANKILKSA